MSELFDKSGGYRKLFSFTYATLIHLGTMRFCERFVTYKTDPQGKTAAQMIGAARSGRQNIIEGSERAATSKETEIKLTDVARASLAELLGDYEIFLASKRALPWSRQDAERQALSALRLPQFHHTDDSSYDYWRYFHEVRLPFDRWLENDDPIVVARAMIVLIHQTMVMLQAQIDHQGQQFLEKGGFRERLTSCRNEVKGQGSSSPACPHCQAPMRLRQSPKGPFWGCTQYPGCKGTRASN